MRIKIMLVVMNIDAKKIVRWSTIEFVLHVRLGVGDLVTKVHVLHLHISKREKPCDEEANGETGISSPTIKSAGILSGLFEIWFPAELVSDRYISIPLFFFLVAL